MDIGRPFSQAMGFGVLNDDLPQPPIEITALKSLIERARAGDSTALGTLINDCRNYLLVIANEELDQRLQGKIGASDVVQESILHAQQSFNQFGGSTGEELKAWLRTILANDIRKCRRSFAAQKRNAAREIAFDHESPDRHELRDQNLTPFSDAVQREQVAALLAAIAELPPDYQQVIQLRNIDELGFTEIGRRMDRSPDAVRKLWARALEALCTVVGQKSPELLEPLRDSYSRKQ